MIRKLIGFCILIASWYFSINQIFPNFHDVEYMTVGYLKIGILAFLFIPTALGLSYSLVQQKDFPVRLIVTALIAEYIIFKFRGTNAFLLYDITELFNLTIGTFLIITGKYGIEAFTFVLSPIKKFLKSIGLNIPLPIIAGISLIPIFIIGFECFDLLRKYYKQT